MIYNDDVTPFAFVVALISQLFSYSNDEAVEKADEAQSKGSAVLGTYPKAIAETKVDVAMKIIKQTGYPLVLKAEK